MIIAAGTIVSSLQSGRLTARFGTGAGDRLQRAADGGGPLRLLHQPLLPGAVPVGGPLRPGGGLCGRVSEQLCGSPLRQPPHELAHCMWGVGASLGPAILGLALSGGQSWSMGYRSIAALQILLTAVLFLSLPLWAAPPRPETRTAPPPRPGGPSPLSAPDRPDSRGKGGYAHLFCYCALEQTTGALGQQLPGADSGGSPLRPPPISPACFSSGSRWGGPSAGF